MFTQNEMRLLETLTTSSALGVFEREIMKDVFEKVKPLETKKPQILVNVNGGAVQYAVGNMDIELVIVDEDLIVNDGNDLDYPCLAGSTQEEFDEQIQKEYEKVLLARAKRLCAEQITETRIFIHDQEDSYPFNVAINGDVIATYKSFDEAYIFLTTYIEARRSC